MKVEVYIEGNKLDLYEDEQITVNSKLQDIQDISKLFTDYSQSFTVPASDNNNSIFSHYYNADIDNGYDARIRKDGVIYVNTLDFKIGKIRLDGATIKNNKPSDYRITFFGKGLSLKDQIGNDKLTDLSWLDSNFNHSNTGANVLTALTDGLDFTIGGTLYEDAIIYPLISYGRQYFYDSTPSEDTFTETLSNISANTSNSVGVTAGDLKPAIRLALIIKAIKEEYDVTFTGGFFDSDIFNDIYMNVNGEQTRYGVLSVQTQVGTIGTHDYLEYDFNITSAVALGGDFTRYKRVVTYFGDVVYRDNNWLEGVSSLNLQILNTTGTEDYAIVSYLEVEGNGTYAGNDQLQYFDGTLNSVFTDSFTGQTPTFSTNIKNVMPDIGVYDFLKSLFKMFNLVITPEQDDIYVNDLQTWYSEGEIYDVTQFVDFESEKVNRGTIYSEINFRFEETDQILAKQFKQSNDAGYGDLEFKLVDENGDDIQDVDGQSLDIDVLFINPIYERLLDQADNTQTEFQYCPMFDINISDIEGTFLFFADSVNVNNLAFNERLFDEDTLATQHTINTQVFMPSHSRQIDNESFNLNFNAEINEYTSQIYTDTLFDRYYSDYITDMFSIKRRLYDFKAIFPSNLLNNIKLNDRLIIKDRRYIINMLSHNLVDRQDTLELINDIYDAPLQSDTLNTSTFRSSSGFYSERNQTDSVTYIGLTNMGITLVDTGDGTSWITLNTPKTLSAVQEVSFTLSANTGALRTAGIQVNDSINNPIYTVYQYAGNGTLDFSQSSNSSLTTILTGIV